MQVLNNEIIIQKCAYNNVTHALVHYQSVLQFDVMRINIIMCIHGRATTACTYVCLANYKALQIAMTV